MKMKRMGIFGAGLLIAGTLGAADFDAYKKQVLKTDGLVRYYTFEEGAGVEAANQVKLDDTQKAPTGGPLGSLTVLDDRIYGWKCQSPDGKRPAPPVWPAWSQGRFAGKSALKIGMAPAAAHRTGISCVGKTAHTFAMWLRPRDVAPEWTANVLKLGDAYNTGFALNIGRYKWAGDGRISLRLGNPKGEFRKVLDGGAFDPGAWHFAAAVFDGKTAQIYVDGKLRGEIPLPGGVRPAMKQDFPARSYIWELFDSAPWHYSTPFLRVGNQGNAMPSDARFDLDELMIFERALPAAEIAGLYESGKPDETPAEQKKIAAALDLREAALDRVKIEIPDDSGGYFRLGSGIPVKLTVPADPFFKGAYKARFTMTQMQGPFRQTVEKIVKPGETVSTVFNPSSCAIYFIRPELLDAAGNVCKTLFADRAVAVVPKAPEGGLTKLNPMGLWAFNNDFSYDSPIRRMMTGHSWMKEKKFSCTVEEFERRKKITPELRSFLCFGYPGKNQLLSKMTPEKRAEWVEYYKNVVETAKKINTFAVEFMSEPDCDRTTPDVAAEVIKLTAPMFRKALPDAKLVPAGACPTGLPWTAAMLKGGIAGDIDGISYHSYRSNPIMECNFGDPSKAIRLVTEPYRKIKELEIWNTESGFDFLPRIGNRPMNSAEARACGYPSGPVHGHEVFTTSMPCAPEEEAAALQTHAILCELSLGFKIYVKCLAAGVSRAPSLQGIAWTALAGQVLNHQTKVTKMPLASLNMACFLIDTDNGKRIAAVCGMQNETLTFKVKPSTVYKSMDMLGNYGTVRSDANGILTLKAGMNPIYVFDVPKDLREAVIVNLELPKRMPENGIMPGKILLDNDFDTPIKGVLRAVPVRGMTIVPAKIPVDLAPRAKREIPFEVRAESLKNKSYPVRFELTQQDRMIAAAARTFESGGSTVRIPRFKKPVELDGNEAKWKNVPSYVCDSLDDVSHGQPNFACLWLPHWKNKDDLSFELKLAWVKDDGVYFFMKVRDDKVLPKPAKRPHLFRYDCLELFTDLRTFKEQGTPVSQGADQTMIRVSDADRLEACLLEYARRRRAQPMVEVTCVGKKIPGGYLLEGRIRPRPESGFKMRGGSQFRMDFTVNDTDNDAEAELRKSAMTLNGVFHNNVAADRWGKYELSLDSVE